MTKKCKLHKIKNIYIKNDIISTLEGRRNGNSVHAILRIARLCLLHKLENKYEPFFVRLNLE